MKRISFAEVAIHSIRNGAGAFRDFILASSKLCLFLKDFGFK